jgi:hypothetical protein
MAGCVYFLPYQARLSNSAFDSNCTRAFSSMSDASLVQSATAISSSKVNHPYIDIAPRHCFFLPILPDISSHVASTLLIMTDFIVFRREAYCIPHGEVLFDDLLSLTLAFLRSNLQPPILSYLIRVGSFTPCHPESPARSTPKATAAALGLCPHSVPRPPPRLACAHPSHSPEPLGVPGRPEPRPLCAQRPPRGRAQRAARAP